MFPQPPKNISRNVTPRFSDEQKTDEYLAKVFDDMSVATSDVTITTDNTRSKRPSRQKLLNERLSPPKSKRATSRPTWDNKERRSSLNRDASSLPPRPCRRRNLVDAADTPISPPPRNDSKRYEVFGIASAVEPTISPRRSIGRSKQLQQFPPF